MCFHPGILKDENNSVKCLDMYANKIREILGWDNRKKCQRNPVTPCNLPFSFWCPFNLSFHLSFETDKLTLVIFFIKYAYHK